ncbi:MAG: serine/threonine protein kinase [Planctomycetaceae bacterium]|nr:serine/threonine protein kinase [Planctomycetaceae bacterium]
MKSTCPPDDELLALATDEPGFDSLREHADHCSECQKRVKFYRGEIAELRSLSHQSMSPLSHHTLPSTEEENLPSGSVIGRYVIVCDLGSGGQADVYRVIDPDLRRDLVLKLSHRRSQDGEGQRVSLLSEGRLLAALDHPGLVRVFDVGLYEGRLYLVLDHVLGRNLEQTFNGKRPPAREAARLIAEVAKVVAYAHQHGVVHGDITPRNILIDNQGHTRLIDFGLSQFEDAWSESSGPRGGTPEFLPPEIVVGEYALGSGPASDVFGLGATLYWLLTGQPPFTGESQSDVIEQARLCQIDLEALRRVHVPGAIARACRQALASNPNARPTADVLAVMLQRAAKQWITRGIAAAVVMVCLALGLFWWWPDFQDDAVSQPGNIVQSVPKVTIDGIRTLSNVLPLHTGDRLSVACNISHGEKAIMLWFNSRGELNVYSPVRDVTDRVDRWVYPAPREQISLPPPEGTDMIFFCRGEPVSEAEIRACFPTGQSLPALPKRNYVELQRSEIVLHGPLKKSEIPNEIYQVETIMKEINRSLIKYFDGVTGIAFPHHPAEDSD